MQFRICWRKGCYYRERSINHIFFPIEYNPQIEAYVKEMGRQKIWTELGEPSDFQILEDVVKLFVFFYHLFKHHF